ncbi:nitroreductase family deazaflavin-dependent oxidoreductase [Cellulomonas sp. PhB143]|uniref:nitroreductase family deazaflavin-dependent oxidoreductase n=1 Tax=Cellulomonas sp. PhB143 TaxID=2485186 RepID=UPI000F477D82|nr:nitroreductase family deazaflavin-dependent oxidoreductase [Cellulomonas sp. PhB143]ROS75417.1 deazaflavin-dependent oxidoreductase (nitroreductase family) [Cellulomonas sp. PhB143]
MPDFNQQIIDEFRANGGSVETAGFGRGLVLVHHRGARSGTERVNPLAAVRTSPDTWLLAASAAGSDKNPDWYHNLLAHPETVIETPEDGAVDVHVTELEGDARDAGWARFTAMSEGFKGYEAKTSRVIPVLELTRR